MSVVNLLGNLMCPEYPAMNFMESEAMRSAENIPECMQRVQQAREKEKREKPDNQDHQDHQEKQEKQRGLLASFN